MIAGTLQSLKLKVDRHPQLPDRFGLLDSSPGHWQTFQVKIEALCSESGPKGSVKVFFLARHGEGFRRPRFSHVILLSLIR